MEPIRSKEGKSLDRRRRRSQVGTRPSSGGFAARLEAAATNAVDNAQSPAPSGQIDAPVERLLDDVHTFGEMLLSDRGYGSAQRYREAVRRFLMAVIPEAGNVEVFESRKDILSRKRYYLLTQINQSVERLVNGVLQSQTEQVEILSRLEEIEGMLVDLTH